MEINGDAFEMDKAALMHYKENLIVKSEYQSAETRKSFSAFKLKIEREYMSEHAAYRTEHNRRRHISQ